VSGPTPIGPGIVLEQPLDVGDPEDLTRRAIERLEEALLWLHADEVI
jgi:hypothetical protein